MFQDFWPIAVGALVTTVLACILIMINVGLKGANLGKEKTFDPPTADGFFTGTVFRKSHF